MKLIQNDYIYWQFIRELRYHPDNLNGFVNVDPVTIEEQIEYMNQHSDKYYICIKDEKPVGFIGQIDGDIRLAVSPDKKKQGIGKFMLDEFMKIHPFSTAKVLHNNISSLKTFYSCGFVSNKVDSQFHYLSRKEYGSYKIKHNPYKIVTMFEECIADYTGAPYALSINSCTNALFLACKYFQVGDVNIPSKTYLSVPQSIMQAGGNVVFDESRNNWTGVYQLEPYPIWDSAKRLTSNMYIPGSYMCLSFHIKKTLKIGKGGMVLTDDKEFVDWFRRARYEGRGWQTFYKDDNIKTMGWNMYMTPQQASHGLCLLQNYPLHVPDLIEDNGYLDLRRFDLFSECSTV
tara:strand:- start:3207 stop:4241 length:1035 start_codon:yes stop_codon:yes gene_type:complete